MLYTKFSLLLPLFHALRLNIFSTVMQPVGESIPRGTEAERSYERYVIKPQRIHHPDTMNRETVHAAEKSSLCPSSDALAGEPGTPSSPQPPSGSLPVLPGDRDRIFLLRIFLLRIPHQRVFRVPGPAGHIPLGITSIPSSREGSELEDGQAAGREGLGERVKELTVENIKMNAGRSCRTVL